MAPAVGDVLDEDGCAVAAGRSDRSRRMPGARRGARRRAPPRASRRAAGRRAEPADRRPSRPRCTTAAAELRFEYAARLRDEVRSSAPRASRGQLSGGRATHHGERPISRAPGRSPTRSSLLQRRTAGAGSTWVKSVADRALLRVVHPDGHRSPRSSRSRRGHAEVRWVDDREAEARPAPVEQHPAPARCSALNWSLVDHRHERRVEEGLPPRGDPPASSMRAKTR